MTENQLPKRYLDVINNQLELYKEDITIQNRNEIPDSNDIPIQESKHWLRIEDVICVFVDMKNSSKMSITIDPYNVAKTYKLFTETAIRLFNEFKASYIDVKGDGVFALFNSNQPYRAFASAMTFKTFANIHFNELTKDAVQKANVGTHIGIDQHTVLVKKLGLQAVDGRKDKQNDVWAGETINMASKLASICDDMQLFVSDRFYQKVSNILVRNSCDCSGNCGLWKEYDLSNNSIFSFDKAWYIGSAKWCGIHGKDFCEKILALDK